MKKKKYNLGRWIYNEITSSESYVVTQNVQTKFRVWVKKIK